MTEFHEDQQSMPPDPFPPVEEDAEPLDIRRIENKVTQRQAVKATTDNLTQVVAWIQAEGYHAVQGDGQLTIQTLEGPFTVRPGDYVIRGIQGEFYRCDPEIYRDSYTDLGPVI